MPRPPLVLETWGKIRRTTVGGKPTAVAYFRDSDGVTRKMQRQGSTPAAAERALVAALRDRVTPTVEAITRESTLDELASEWLNEIEKQGKAVATLARYRSTVRAHINAHVGGVRIREATAPRLQRLVDRVAEKSGPSQARMLGVVLVGMMSLAVRYGAVPSSTAAELRLPERQRVAVRAPKVNEVHALRRALRVYDAAPAHRDGSVRDLADFGDVLLGTGCRPGKPSPCGGTTLTSKTGGSRLRAQSPGSPASGSSVRKHRSRKHRVASSRSRDSSSTRSCGAG